MLAQEIAVIAGDEADFHALAFLGFQGIALVPQVVAHLLLGVGAEGEDATLQHVLPQSPEEVRLVLLLVIAHADEDAPVPFLQAGVVSGRDIGTSQLVGPLRQDTELEQGVAHDARIGRAAVAIFVNEVLHHRLAEALALVGNVVLDAHRFGQLPGFHGFVAPHPHRQADDFIALLAQHETSGGTVYTATHAYQYSLVGSHACLWVTCSPWFPSPSLPRLAGPRPSVRGPRAPHAPSPPWPCGRR